MPSFGRPDMPLIGEADRGGEPRHPALTTTTPQLLYGTPRRVAYPPYSGLFCLGTTPLAPIDPIWPPVTQCTMEGWVALTNPLPYPGPRILKQCSVGLFR
jgi:hypothetical protein